MEIRWLCELLVLLLLGLISEVTLANNLMAENFTLPLYNNEEVNLQSANKIENDNDNIRIASEKATSSIFNEPHSRKKRLIWITDDGRMALPPGTSLSITPTISMPLVRYPFEGFHSNISISFPVTIDFDKLGLTDNSNPLGVLPPIFERSFGRAAGSMLANYIAHYVGYRRKRSLSEAEPFEIKNNYFHINSLPEENIKPPKLPKEHKNVFHGGERVLLYGAVEDLISTFGLNGRACLLRAICEVHSNSMNRFGFFGEVLKLFLTATKSPFSEYIIEYVNAQRIGEGHIAPGECFPYHKDCPKSIFKAYNENRYRNNQQSTSSSFKKFSTEGLSM